MASARHALRVAWSVVARIIGIPEADKDDLEAWRARVFFGLSLAMVTLAIPALAASTARVLEIGGHDGYLVTLAALYAALLFVVLNRRLPIAVRMWTTLSLFYVLALTSLWTAGLSGTGRTYLLGFVVMATLLRGKLGFWVSMTLSAAAMFTISYLVSAGRFEPSMSFALGADRAWPMLSVSLLFACGAVGAAVAVLVRGLERLVVRLSEEQARLDARVHERTAALEAAMVELQASKERFLQLAIRDDLTGLYSRRFASETLSRTVEGLRRNPGIVSVVVLDVDRFKAINDTFGHPEGDRILCAVARAIERAVRSTDTVARFGGEEFLAVLPMTNLAGAVLVAERVRSAVEREVRSPCQVTVSAGVAELAWLGASRTESPEALVRSLIERADEALYEAKRRGRNCVVAGGSAPEIPIA